MTIDAKSAYRQTAGQSASPLHLVALLYEQMAEDLRRALTAIEQGDTEKRSQEIGHAIEVVGYLQNCLDMERGGDVARNLDRFYTLLRGNLLQAQFQSSARILRRQFENLLTLREAWLEVERVESADSAPAPAVSQAGGERTLNWSV